jgi:hypothetical protein
MFGDMKKHTDLKTGFKSERIDTEVPKQKPMKFNADYEVQGVDSTDENNGAEEGYTEEERISFLKEYRKKIGLR